MEQQTRAAAGGDTANIDERVVRERSGGVELWGSSGVSDLRRAELEQLEIDSGTEHEAPDEGVVQRAKTGQNEAGREWDSPAQTNAGSTGNPDIDKR